MTQRSKSTLFLIEQLIVVAVFALCAVACVSIMVAAYVNANESHTLSHALHKAESGAEVFKATSGNANAIANILGGVSSGDIHDSIPSSIIVYYDHDWQTINHNTEDAQYILTIMFDKPQQTTGELRLVTGQLNINRATGEELITLPLTARKG